jgi:hypothetical protein
MTSPTGIESDLDRHAERVAAGFASIGNSEPRRRFTGLPPELRDHATPPEPVLESTDARVLRESGVIGKYDLRWLPLADITAHTGGMLSKAKLAALRDAQEILEKFAAEIDAAGRTPLSAGKIVAAANLGEMPTGSAIEAAIHGDDARTMRKRIAKQSARRFFDEVAAPLALEVFAKAGEMLAGVIDERRKAEQSAFERFSEIYNDADEAAVYRPSPGLLRLLARRRQLLDGEISLSSPPSLRTSLSGVVIFPAP